MAMSLPWYGRIPSKENKHAFEIMSHCCTPIKKVSLTEGLFNALLYN
jgi:hypothetical protein